MHGNRLAWNVKYRCSLKVFVLLGLPPVGWPACCIKYPNTSLNHPALPGPDSLQIFSSQNPKHKWHQHLTVVVIQRNLKAQTETAKQRFGVELGPRPLGAAGWVRYMFIPSAGKAIDRSVSEKFSAPVHATAVSERHGLPWLANRNGLVRAALGWASQCGLGWGWVGLIMFFVRLGWIGLGRAAWDGLGLTAVSCVRVVFGGWGRVRFLTLLRVEVDCFVWWQL